MVREKIAIGNVRDDDSFERAATVLRLNGFQENQLPSGVLHHYFAIGEESVIEGGSLFLSEGELAEARIGEPSGKGIEVIIPSSVVAGSGSKFSRIGMLPEVSKGNAKEDGSIEIADSEGGQASEEEVLKNLMECMESKGFLFNYRYSPIEAPSLGSSIDTERGNRKDEALLERLGELTGLLKTLIIERGDGDLVSKSRLESDGWETDRESDLYKRINPEYGRGNARPSPELVESIMRGLGNIESDLK